MKNDNLEEKFKAALAEALPQLREKLQAAEALIDEVTDIADKYGIPVNINLGGYALQNEYVPSSFSKKKFDQVEDLYEIVEAAGADDVVNAYNEGYDGWQRSFC